MPTKHKQKTGACLRAAPVFFISGYPMGQTEQEFETKIKALATQTKPLYNAPMPSNGFSKPSTTRSA
jgi:hypothetical protein